MVKEPSFIPSLKSRPSSWLGATFDHFCDMLCLLVDGHCSDDAAMWRGGGQLDLDWTSLGNLTVELLQ